MEDCVACGDRLPSPALFRSPCSHHHCRDCLISLIRSSFQDESLFPPRCCGKHIPIVTGEWLSPALVGEFRAKKLEYDTTDRTYCSEPTCSTFVPPAVIGGEEARCPKCGQKTCIHCKGPSHSGVCSKDGEAQQVLQLAAQNGWQQCYACHRVIELDHGCHHMS